MTEIKISGKRREPYHNLHLPIEIWDKMTEDERLINSMLLLPGIYDSQSKTYIMQGESMQRLLNFQIEMKEKYGNN